MLQVLESLTIVALLASATVAGMGSTTSAEASCSEQNSVAIFVFENLWPAFTPRVSTLAVTPVGASVYPTEDEIRSNLAAVLGTPIDPVAGQVAGHMWCWSEPAGDIGWHAVVDRRDGAVVFGGGVIWGGRGTIWRPATSTHNWSVAWGGPAAGPATTNTIASPFGGGVPLGHWLTTALTYLRTLDVVASFAECGPYDAVAWLYVPEVGVGATILDVKLIVAIDGTVGAPWNVPTVAIEHTSWGAIKAQYR